MASASAPSHRAPLRGRSGVMAAFGVQILALMPELAAILMALNPIGM